MSRVSTVRRHHTARTEMRRTIPLVLLLCTTACDPAADAERAPATGLVVEDTAPRWKPEDRKTLDTIPELIIGEVDGRPESELSSVVGAVRLTDGRVVIANQGTHELRFYDGHGHPLGSAGREGNGPGEFRWIEGIATDGDTILVWDGFARRVSRLDGNGRFVSSTSLAELDLPFPRLIGFLDDGSVLLRPRTNFDTNGGREGKAVDSVTYLRFSTTTGAQIAALGPYLGGEIYWATAGRNWMSSPVIFGNRGLVASARAGYYRAESDRFEATFHTPGGIPVRTLRRPHEQVRATGEDVAVKRKELEKGDEGMLRRDPDMAPVQRRLLDNLPHRATLPAISQLRVDREDNLWIQAYTRPDAESAEWSVFDPEGHWLGVVSIPTHLEVLEIGDDYLLAKTVDPLDDVERVVLHRLRKRDDGQGRPVTINISYD